MMVKIEKTRVKLSCDIHGCRTEVAIVTEDAMGFRHRVRVCEGCFDDAVHNYLRDTAVCADCGNPVPPGTGFEFDGVFTPVCFACQAKRITKSVNTEKFS